MNEMVHAKFSSGNGLFRDECLNVDWLSSIDGARAKTWDQYLVIFKVRFRAETLNVLRGSIVPVK
jgi:hypothetical protein